MSLETRPSETVDGKRLSVPLTAKDLADLVLIRLSPERLAVLPGHISQDASDATVVHAVFVAGLARIKEEFEMSGYIELAADDEYVEHRAERRAAATPTAQRMTGATFLRGEVWAAVLPGMTEEKYYLVVSNNSRNKALKTCLVVRITSSPKPEISSIVRIPFGECVDGRVLCDDIEDMWEDDARRKLGAFTTTTMRLVNDGLSSALALA